VISQTSTQRPQQDVFSSSTYEGTRHNAGNNRDRWAGRPPTALERQGNFTQSLIDNGRGRWQNLRTPLTGPVVKRRYAARSLFRANVIPDNRFDPLSKVYLGYYPLAPIMRPLPRIEATESNFVGTSTNSPAATTAGQGRPWIKIGVPGTIHALHP